MARLAKRPTPDDSGSEQQTLPSRSAGARSRSSANRLRTASPESRRTSTSPTSISLSDKENSRSAAPRNAKGKARMSRLGESSRRSRAPASSNKRRRTGDRDSSRAVSVTSENVGEASDEEQDASSTQQMDKAALRRALNDITDTQFYDPEQDPMQRRRYRSNLGALSKDLVDNKNEYLQSHNAGLTTTLRKVNNLFSNVKQTSDAALDSKLLVTAGDLSAKRAVANKYGGSEVGIDVDEFVTKCAAFMRRGPSEAELRCIPQASQRRHAMRDAHANDSSDSEAEGRGNDNGDELNWSWLGLGGAFSTNKRPPTIGFLLGPLSVQKKTRTLTQRRARQGRRDPADAKRPDELQAEDIERQENANLTALCRKIFRRLTHYVGAQQAAVERAMEALPDADAEDEGKIDAILRDHHVSEDGGVCLFHFAFNPQSFGQTVENLFYISFLIRDGHAGIVEDKHGLLTLVPDPGERMRGEDELSPEELAAKEKENEARNRSVTKLQSVFHLDFDMWRECCEGFQIQECVIPHRVEDGGRAIGANGWYG